MKKGNLTLIAGFGLVAAVIYAAHRGSEVIAETAGDFGDAVTPLNNQNVFARGANALTEFIADPLGDTPERITLGGAVHRGVERVRSIWE